LLRSPRTLLVVLALFATVAVAAPGLAEAKRPPPKNDNSAPSTPSGLTVGTRTQTSITISWSASSDNVGVAGYTVYRNGSSVGTTGSTSYTVTGLSCDSAYTLAVDAYDAAGNHSGQASANTTTTSCSDTTAPSTPGGLTVGTRTQGSISLSWTASSDNVAVTGYTVYRNGSSVGTTTGTAFTVSGLTCNTGYTLAVDAYDAAGNHSTKTSSSVTTAACVDTTPPSTPSGLTATNIAQTSITLNWSASSDNVGVAGYALYRDGNQVGTTTGKVYAFGGLSCASSTTLGVAAYDAAGNRSALTSLTRQTAQCQGQPDVSSFVQRSGKTLVVNGSRYTFTGLNAYMANSRNNCGANIDLGATLDAWGAGKEVVRAWFFQNLATTNGARDWTAFDQTLATAKAHGYRVIVTLANQWADCDQGYGYKADTWYRSGYQNPDPSGTVSYRDYVAEIVARYKDDPTILMWQLMNEAEDKTSQNGSCPTDAATVLKRWATDVSGLIKSIDPNHLVSLGTIGGGTCGASMAQYQSIHDIPTIDVCEVHDYGSPTVPMPGDQWNGMQAEINYCGNLNKPLFVGETGIWTQVVTPQDRANEFSAKLTAQFGAGVVGELAWSWGPDGSSGYDIGAGDPSLDVFGV
jgi:mannan endo-1,4-beta-mannosidase